MLFRVSGFGAAILHSSNEICLAQEERTIRGVQCFNIFEYVLLSTIVLRPHLLASKSSAIPTVSLYCPALIVEA